MCGNTVAFQVEIIDELLSMYCLLKVFLFVRFLFFGCLKEYYTYESQSCHFVVVGNLFSVLMEFGNPQWVAPLPVSLLDGTYFARID